MNLEVEITQEEEVLRGGEEEGKTEELNKESFSLCSFCGGINDTKGRLKGKC
jgi:hypothetical protein